MTQDMTFGRAISTCFNKYADFTGRATRAEYWWWYLFQLLMNFAVAFVTILIVARYWDWDADYGMIDELTVPYISCGVVGLVLFLPSLAVTVRRLHDTGRSGWAVLWSLIPFIGGIVLLVFLLTESGPDNRYGPNPFGWIGPVRGNGEVPPPTRPY